MNCRRRTLRRRQSSQSGSISPTTCTTSCPARLPAGTNEGAAVVGGAPRGSHSVGSHLEEQPRELPIVWSQHRRCPPSCEQLRPFRQQVEAIRIHDHRNIERQNLLERRSCLGAIAEA